MRLFYLILFLFLTSCEIGLIYSNDNKNDYIKELAAIKIQKDRGIMHQKLRNNLFDVLNPDLLEEKPKYFLALTINGLSSSVFITTTGASGRNQVNLDIAYEFKNMESGAVISSSFVSVIDSYNIYQNRYGTKLAEDYAKSNLTSIAATQIRNRLVNDLILLRKKCFSAITKDNKDVCAGVLE